MSRAFAAEGLISWLAAPPSMAVVARCLGGGGGGQNIPRKLAQELPRIFCRTLGAWAAGEREEEVKRMFPAPTTGPGKEGDSEDSEEDVEEGDDRVLQALRQTQAAGALASCRHTLRSAGVARGSLHTAR